MGYIKLGRNVRRLILMFLLFTVAVYMIIIQHIKTNTKMEKKKKLIRDHEEALCNFRLNKSIVWTPQIGYECPVGGIVTVFYGGGLESQMWAYSSVWAVARLTSLKPYVPICMHSFLSRVFDGLSIYPLSEISDCDISLPTAATSFPDWSGENESLVLPVFSCLSNNVIAFLDDIIKQFRLKRYLVDRADRILRDFANGRLENSVFVGVPVPGNWESMADGLYYPDKYYYETVFDFIRVEKQNKTVFVIVSDEEISRTGFFGSDVFFVNTGGSHFGLNLALLALCNMSVLGFEGIGLWGALLSKGEALLFSSYRDNFETYISNLPRFQVF